MILLQKPIIHVERSINMAGASELYRECVRTNIHAIYYPFLEWPPKRLAGRLHTIKAALDLASGLLTEEGSLLQEFLGEM